MAKTESHMVDLRIPRGRSNEEPYVMIGINGVNWQLPKGQTSKVPQYVADEYNRAQEAAESLSETIDSIQREEQAANAYERAKIGG